MKADGPLFTTTTTTTRLLCCIFCCCVQYYFLLAESFSSLTPVIATAPVTTLKNHFSTAVAIKNLKQSFRCRRSSSSLSSSSKLFAESESEREWSESEIERFPYAAASVTATTTTETEGIPTSRFVVQNRFKVRKGREAVFEKRWADRKSRLGTLPGFRFFCILRKIDANDNNNDSDSDSDNDDPNNYVSFTVWDKFENFEAWKKGDAFKEAHGGGTVKGVISMLAATARNTKGKPKPAYWKGLLPETPTSSNSDDEGESSSEGEGGGWRQIETDGTTILPQDCFAAMNRFSVAPTMETEFERKFADRESTLKDCEGFKGFLLLRRDGTKQPGDGGDPDDGYTHSTFSIWDEKANFDAWMASNKNKSSNNRKPMKGNDKDNNSDNNTANANPNATTKKGGPPKIYTRPPVPSFYEGILMLESKTGM